MWYKEHNKVIPLIYIFFLSLQTFCQCAPLSSLHVELLTIKVWNRDVQCAFLHPESFVPGLFCYSAGHSAIMFYVISYILLFRLLISATLSQYLYAFIILCGLTHFSRLWLFNAREITQPSRLTSPMTHLTIDIFMKRSIPMPKIMEIPFCIVSIWLSF